MWDCSSSHNRVSKEGSMSLDHQTSVLHRWWFEISQLSVVRDVPVVGNLCFHWFSSTIYGVIPKTLLSRRLMVLLFGFLVLRKRLGPPRTSKIRELWQWFDSFSLSFVTSRSFRNWSGRHRTLNGVRQSRGRQRSSYSFGLISGPVGEVITVPHSLSQTSNPVKSMCSYLLWSLWSGLKSEMYTSFDSRCKYLNVKSRMKWNKQTLFNVQFFFTPTTPLIILSWLEVSFLKIIEWERIRVRKGKEGLSSLLSSEGTRRKRTKAWPLSGGIKWKEEREIFFSYHSFHVIRSEWFLFWVRRKRRREERS